jgi:shikimate dehydrogenase
MAAELADILTIRARQCKSVNTLIIENGHITGDSTDGIGLERALMHNFALPVKGKNFIFLGAGGAARATAIHFASAGAKRIMFVNRTASKAFEIMDDIDELQTGCFCAYTSPGETDVIAAELKICDCIIQATSLGLKEDDPAPIDLNLLEINKNTVIFDTIYKNTKLLQKATGLGIRCSGGKEMLIQQGAESFRLWTNKEPDLDAMRAGFELPPGGVEV